MAKFDRVALLGCVLIASAMVSGQAIGLPMLVDFQVDVDGTTVASTIDASDVDGFDEDTGLGTIEVTVATPGPHAVRAYVDHGFGPVEFDEQGSASGTAAAGQSWEVDDPWLGDLFDKLCPFGCGGTFDNAAFAGTGLFDVSMALGWDFTLEVDQQAIVSFTLAQTLPVSDFYLVHEDAVTAAAAFEDVDTGVLYFSSLLSIESTETDSGDGSDPPDGGDGGSDPPDGGDGGSDPPDGGSNDVPLPATLWLVAVAAVAMRFARRRADDVPG